MNRDYNIDNILAEIKIKKDERGRPARRIQSSASLDDYLQESMEQDYGLPRYGRQDYEEPSGHREVRRQEPRREENKPQQHRVPQEEPRRQEPDYAEYEPIRPARRKATRRYEEEQLYEPASAIFALAEETEKKRVAEQKLKSQPPQKPKREAAREPEEYYQPKTPARSARQEQPEEYYQPKTPARSARQEQPEETQQTKENPRFSWGKQGRKEAPSLEDFRLDYEVESVGAEAFGAVESLPPRTEKSILGRRKGDAEDEFMAKFSQVTPLGSRKLPRIDRDHVRSHFGEAESISPKMPKPRPYQRAMEIEAEPGTPRFSKPELKGGFRMEPEDFSLEDTRLNLPLSLTDPQGFDERDLEDTRSLPMDFDYQLDEPYPLEDADGADEFDDSPARMAMDEFETADETTGVREDLATMRRGLMVRFTVTFLSFLCLLYLGLSQAVALPMPGVISAQDAPGAFAGVALGLIAIAAIACHTTISSGIVGLFTLKANNDSLAALAALACVMQSVAVLLNPLALGSVQLYAPAAAACLLFNTIGRIFTLGRVNGNFRFVSSGAQKYTAQVLQERELGRELTWDMNIDQAHVAYSTRADFVEGFIEQSYASDATDNIAKITSPIIFLASVAVAVFAYVMGSDIFMTLSVFAAVLCIATPLTACIVGSLPLHKAYRALSRRGAMLSGYNAVERFADTNVVLADACDLFTSDEVLLHSIKTFAKTRIDDAILDAASVLCMCNGAVKNIFLRIIQGNTKMLKYVENIVYEDAMGISAWVSGKRVLIGNSDLMKHHGIDTPSRDYEAKYRTEDRDILYLANSGELTAMFVISYVANRDVDEALGDLERKGISVVVRSVDPNLTATKIARIYDLPEEMIRILPAKLHVEFEALCGADRERDRGYIAHNGTFLAFARAVSAAGAARVATNIGLIVQIVGMVLGYALVTFFSFMGAMDQAGLATVLVFQAVWCTAVWMFTGMRRI